MKTGALVALAFPLVYFGLSLVGWSNGMFNWWGALLMGLVNGVVFWFCTSSFRRFRDEDVTPRK